MFYHQTGSTQSPSSRPQQKMDPLKALTNVFSAVSRPLIEIAYGVISKRIPLTHCFLWANFAGGLILLKWDRLLFVKLGLIKLYPYRPPFYWTYCVICMGGGFLGWGILQTLLRNRLIQRLTEVFIEAGLKSPLGKLPAFIHDVPVDEFTRKLRLGRSSFSMQQFDKAKPMLESSLQIYVDELRENRERGSIDIIYSHYPMPSMTKIENITQIPALTFVIGKTRAHQITTSLRNVPHLLVGGQTGGGKSTFLRGLITTLYLNNKDFQFTLIDLKGGLEFQTFDKLTRVKVTANIKDAVDQLKWLGTALNQRMELFRANECKDIDAYLAIPLEKRKEIKNGPLPHQLGRQILIVDEAAEMFLAGSHADANEIQTARKILSQIARQGRSVGVHLIVATQRPDAKALDPQVKANLTGVVCFQMLNDASSISVLGVGRATDLPAVPGRAIWKWGADMMEVQTPYLSTEEVDLLLENFRSEKAKVNS